MAQKKWNPHLSTTHRRRRTTRSSRWTLVCVALIAVTVVVVFSGTVPTFRSTQSSSKSQTLWKSGSGPNHQEDEGKSHQKNGTSSETPSWSFYSEHEPHHDDAGASLHHGLPPPGIPLGTAIRRERYQYRPPRPRTPHDWHRAKMECGTAPHFEKFFAQDSTQRSLRKEDKTIYNLFFKDYIFAAPQQQQQQQQQQPPPRDGSKTTATLPTTTGLFNYVEIGAVNGMRESNSRFFDVCLGMTGILIEANPLKYTKLLETRPHAHTFQFAASCGHDKEDTAAKHDHLHYRYTPVNATIGFHNVSFTNAAQHDVVNAQIFKADGDKRLTQVPCGSMTPVLLDVLSSSSSSLSSSLSSSSTTIQKQQQHQQDKKEVAHVNFFSLDVEGAEAMVLQCLDFTKLIVDVWIVETSNHYCQQVCPSRDQVRAILLESGYVGYQEIIKGSDLYIRGSDDDNDNDKDNTATGGLSVSWMRQQLIAWGVTDKNKLPPPNL
jgi:Methyltransferase FkbM domain